MIFSYRAYFFLRDSKVPQDLLGFAQFQFPQVSVCSHHWFVALVGRQPSTSLSLECDTSSIVKWVVPLGNWSPHIP